MINYAPSEPTWQLANQIGPDYFVFVFEGQVPSSLEDVPFNLFTQQPDHPFGSQYKNLDWVSIYNNMISTSLVKASVSSNPGLDIVRFKQGDVNNTKPKASYLHTDSSRKFYVPESVDTNLLEYMTLTSTNLSYCSPFSWIFWDGYKDLFGANAGCYMDIPSSESDFYIESDFGKEVSISTVVYEANSTSRFEGTAIIEYWDSSLNNGEGDWAEAGTFDYQNTFNQIIEIDEVVTSKIKITFDSPSSRGRTSIYNLRFIGPNDNQDEVEKDIGWALIIPKTCNPDTYSDLSKEIPLIMVSAGGPAESEQELLFNTAKATPGRYNNIISGDFQFKAKETTYVSE